jgi:ribosomal protein L37E
MSQRSRLEDRFTITCQRCGEEWINPQKQPAQKWGLCPACGASADSVSPTVKVRRIKPGDRIRFRSLTRWSDEQVWRTVVGISPIRVRFGGWPDFVVKGKEISAHKPGKGDA